MESIVSRDEIRRLEKAAREKDKKKLAEWLKSFEAQIDTILRRNYEKAYQEEVLESIENMMTAVVYTSLFSEENYINKENIGDFMSDLYSTLDLYRTGEYTPKEYKEILKNYGVTVSDYDSDLVYKKFLNIFDTDLVRLLKGNYRKIVTICGNSEYRDAKIDAVQRLTMLGYIVIDDGLFNSNDTKELYKEELQQLKDLQNEKILIANVLYVVNVDNNINDEVKSLIEFAKEHNKEIQYLVENN